MKEYSESSSHGKSKMMKEAKLIRRKNASEKGPVELHKQKIREKSVKHSKDDLAKAHKHMREHSK